MPKCQLQLSKKRGLGAKHRCPTNRKMASLTENQQYTHSWSFFPRIETVSMLTHIFCTLKNDRWNTFETLECVYGSHRISHYFHVLWFEFVTLDTLIIKARGDTSIDKLSAAPKLWHPRGGYLGPLLGAPRDGAPRSVIRGTKGR